MPPGLPGLPKIKLPENPLGPLRKVVHEGHQQIEKAGRDIHSIADEIRGFTTTEPPTPSTAPESQKEPSSSRSATSFTSPSKLTNDEILAYQNREIGRELWQLEKHLSQGCRIPDRTGKPVPCDCCEKGSFIAGLAYESIPIAERGGKPSTTYEKIAKWAEELEPMVTVPAVESGQYDYKKLSGQASALRKELMGSLAFGALLSPKDRTEIAERATKMLEGEEI